MHILIIEDSDSIRRMIEALVSARGYEVDAVSTGAKGLEVAFDKVPDVILLDLNLAGSFDGFEVCARVRQNPLTRATPIIAIGSDDDTKTRAMTAGASAYYTKPFSPIAVLKEIESVRVRQRSTPSIV